MVKKITRNNLFKLAQSFKDYVEAGKGIPYKFTFDGISYYTLEMEWAFLYGIFHLKTDFTIPNFQWPKNAFGDNIIEDVTIDDYKQQCKNVFNYVAKNGQLPNYVTTIKSKKRVNIDLFGYCMAKVLVWYHEHGGELPNYCTYDSRALSGKGSQPTNYSQDILNYFSNKIGRPSSIDDALAKVQNKGYGYYYDDKLSNKQSIDGLATRGGTKPNCTDIHHVFWHIGKALGYDVRAVHVKCRGGDGHVRLDFKHPTRSNNQWFSRDASAVADGECVECIWCGNGALLAYNPSWFMQNLER